jgi:hypothetical protein
VAVNGKKVKNKIITTFASDLKYLFKMDKTTKILDKDTRDEISFISFIIPEFALAYKMNVQQAYRYLKKYGGLDYLYENWWALHTDNPFWAVRDMYEICRKNGGMR